LTKKEYEMGNCGVLLNYRQKKTICPTLDRIREQGTLLLTDYLYITQLHIHMNQKHKKSYNICNEVMEVQMEAEVGAQFCLSLAKQ
jgi:propanediol utilization protein